MEAEDIKLLLKELCARQYYSPTLSVRGSDEENVYFDLISVNCSTYQVLYENRFMAIRTHANVELVRPYLRSLSTMTEEEKKEFCDICTGIAKDKEHFVMEGSIDSNFMLEKLEWCYKHHFNIKLPKHLFIEMPEDWYKKCTRLRKENQNS